MHLELRHPFNPHAESTIFSSQIDELRDRLAMILERCGVEPVMQSFNPLDSSSPSNTQITISVCDNAGKQLVCVIQPAFAGSASNNSVAFTACCAPDHVTKQAPSPASADSESLFYTSFAPLADSWHELVSPADTALVLLAEGPIGIDSTLSDARTIIGLLSKLTHIRKVCLLATPLVRQSATNSLGDVLRRNSNYNIIETSWKFSPSQLHAVMARSNIVLCAGTALYADALMLGVPVYTWRQHIQAEDINDAVMNTVPFSRRVVVEKQRLAIERLPEKLRGYQRRLHLFPNYLPALESAIISTLSGLARRYRTIDYVNPTVLNDGHIIEPRQVAFDYNGALKISTRGITTIRKLKKLRESPSRFIKDSNTPLSAFFKPFTR